MSTLFTGSCYLNCNAYLDNPHPVYEGKSEYCCVVDTTFPTSDSGVICKYMVASLTYCPRTSSNTFVPGVYEIHAKVHFLLTKTA
jgi:hypothetical protein